MPSLFPSKFISEFFKANLVQILLFIETVYLFLHLPDAYHDCSSFSRFVHNTYTAAQYETGMYCKLFLFPAFALMAFCFQFNINVTSLLPAGIFCVKSGLLLREKEGKIFRITGFDYSYKLVPFAIQLSTERDLANCQEVDLGNTWRHV